MRIDVGKLSQAMKTNPSMDKKPIHTQSTNEPNKPKDITEVSRDFASIFFNTLLQSMDKTIMKSGLMDGGNAESIYRSMLNSEYAKVLSEAGNTGLPKMIERELTGILKKQKNSLKTHIKTLGEDHYRNEALKNSLSTRTIGL